MELSSVIQITFNSRGLANLPTEGGGRVAPVLFRSDALASLTPAGIQALADLGIGTVIDLRTDAERARAADVLPEDGSVEFVPLPVLGGAMDEMVQRLLPASGATASPTPEQLAAAVEQVPTLPELYTSILENSAAQFVALARAVIAAAPTERPGVLFHCTAGKDRTGLAAALLLSVAGVSRDRIVADYTKTEANLAGPFAQQLKGLITSMGMPLTPRLETLATKSPAEAIEAALDWVAAEHGDAHGYLASGGLSDAESDELRGALVNQG